MYGVPLLLATLSYGTPAAAAELFARGPAACPDANDLAFRLERTLGAPLVRSSPLRFGVVFEPPPSAGGRYTATLSVRDAAGATRERVLGGLDCSGLGDAVAVAIALAIGAAEAEPTPAEGAAAPQDTPGTAGSVVPDPSTVVVADSGGATGPAAAARAPSDGGARPPPAAREASSGLSPVLAASALVDVGSLPAPALGVSLEVAVRESRWALRVAGTWLFDQHVALRDATGAPGAELGFLMGSLSGCAVPLGSYRANSAVFVCAGWELGRLTAAGEGVSAPRASHQLWAAPRLEAGLSVAVPDTALRLNMQLVAAVPLKRDDFFLRDLGNLHEVPGAVGRFALGADVVF